MARTTIDYPIMSRTARAGLPARTGTANKPYWRTIAGPVAIGWQAPAAAGSAGRWFTRKSFGGGQYSTQAVGTADDIAAADGVRVLSFEQAVVAAQAIFAADRPIAAGDLTVQDAVEAYLTESDSNHVDGMRRTAQREIYSSIFLNKGRSLVRDLTRAQLTRWRNDLVAKLQANKRARLASVGRTESTDEIVRKSKDSANKVLSLLNAALNHAFASPANGLKSDTEWRIALAKFGKVSRARQHHFTQAETQRLIDTCPDQSFALLLTAGFLIGARYGELANANVRDFNATAGLLHIPQSKTGQARFVPLADDTVKFFAAQVQSKLPNAPIFTRRNGSRWGDSHQQRVMKASLKAAGLDQSATFYAMRHSHISRALEANMNPQEIAENCGTSVRMIAENYSHIEAAKKRANLNKLGLRISAAPLAVAA
jgi:integrase